MSHSQDAFTKIFILVLAILAIFCVAAIILANSIGDVEQDGVHGSVSSETAIENRIAPIGSVSVVGDPEPVAEVVETAKAEAPEVAAAPRSGKEVVTTFCFACHGTGAAGAPVIGNKDQWAARVSQGFDAILASAMKGKGAMPPRGASTASDEELKAAVTYMFEQVGANVN